MTILKTIAAATMAAAMLSAAHAGPIEDQKAFAKFVFYTEACGVDPTIIAPETYDMMKAFAEMQLSESERRTILPAAKADIARDIAIFGLRKFCATYGAENMPYIRSMNEALGPKH